jgi:hypothetical protein
MLTILLTFAITTGGFVTLLILALRRVGEYWRENEEGMQAIVRHGLLPLLGKKKNHEQKKAEESTGELGKPKWLPLLGKKGKDNPDGESKG